MTQLCLVLHRSFRQSRGGEVQVSKSVSTGRLHEPAVVRAMVDDPGQSPGLSTLWGLPSGSPANTQRAELSDSLSKETKYPSGRADTRLQCQRPR